MKNKELKRILITYSIVCCGAFIGYFARRQAFPELSAEDNLTIALFTPVMVAVVWESLRGVNHLLNRLMPFEKNTAERIAAQLFIGLFIMLTLRYLVFDVLRVQTIRSLELGKGFSLATYLIYLAVALLLNFGFFAEYFFRRWKDSIQYTERLQKEKAQVQLDNLKSQLNPHFLFNALTSLNSLIFENQELASQFLQQLSRIYRYLLQHKDKNAVPLKTELEFINNYTFLLKVRFTEALHIDIRVESGDLEKGIVPATLQAMIENAIKHNMLNEQKPLFVKVYIENDYLVVSNNIQRKSIVENSNKHGLENLKNLYQYLSDRPVIISEEGYFYVRLPLLEL